MPFMNTSLPLPWNQHLQHIDRISQTFWEERSWSPDPVRLQSMETWARLRQMLERIISSFVLEKNRLTPVELFLLQAATCLYETGWQVPYALKLPLKKRYIESGCLIRNSVVAGAKLELNYLETTTINALACISSAPGCDDLSALSGLPEPVGYEETASLRYLSALFQLADYLFIRRVNKRTMANLIDSETLDPLNARLLLQPYIPFVNIHPGGVTASFELHPDDKHLAKKMSALFTDPIHMWWDRNSSWLNEQFDFSFILHTPHINIMQSAAAPEPLAITCKALATFLENYIPQGYPKSLDYRSERHKNYTSTSSTSERPVPTVTKEAEVALTPVFTKRIKAFISYSHKDRKYLEELRVHLKPYAIDAWDATQIEVGANWHEQINQALEATKVAIILVSADFLASDFISKNELPSLLMATEKEGAIIVSVIIGPCAFGISPLARFAPLNPLDKPLKLMKRPGERDIVWNQVAELVKNALAGES